MADGRYDVAVVGAGPNGLAAATRLARRGQSVVLLERRELLGGIAAGEEFHPGYRTAGLLHDTSGLSPAVVKELDLESHGLRLAPGPMPVLVAQREGRGLQLGWKPSAAAAEIAILSKEDSRRYAEFCAFFDRVGGFLRRVWWDLPPQSGIPLAAAGLAFRRLKKADAAELLRMGPMCVADWLNEWFETELLKVALAGSAVAGCFVGPWSPGTSSILLRHRTMAARPVVGGPAALVESLASAARAAGVTIRERAEVAGISVAQGKVEGVSLRDGDVIEAPVVLTTCDPKTVFLKLVPGRDVPPELEHRIRHFRTAGCTARVSLAVDRPFRFASRPDEDVEHAHLGETLDDLERAFDPLKYDRLPERPWLEVHVASLAREDRAPEGHGAVTVLVHHVPRTLEGGWNDAARDRLGDIVLKVLADYAPEAVKGIVAREVQSPADLEDRYGIDGGHVFHGDHGLDHLVARPVPECARFRTPIEGLVLGGSGSHPGGGVTCVPGYLAAGVVLAGS